MARQWLRSLRKAHGFAQEELARRVGVQRPVVSQWESGARRPGYDKMLALSELLGAEVMERFASERFASESKADGRVA